LINKIKNINVPMENIIAIIFKITANIKSPIYLIN